MLRALFQAFTHPIAGPVGFALALVLCALLVATTTTASRTEAVLRARVAELTTQNQRTNTLWRARLSACQGAAIQQADPHNHLTNASAEARAQRLTGAPAGFDVCARMESADRAVLDTLK